MNLYEIFRTAGGGDAAALAARLGVSEEELARAVEALAPAFSAGLKRSTADPLGLLDFFRRVGAFDYSRAFRDPAWAAEAGRRGGEDAAAFLFGSPEAARAVAQQAAAFAGLAQETLARLMPPLAAALFGGLASEAAKQNPLLDAAFKAAAGGPPAEPARKGPLDRYEEEQAAREAARNAAADLARMQRTMGDAGLAAFQAGTAAWQRMMGELLARGGSGAGAPAAQISGRDLFGEMFESGLEVSEAYRRQIEAAMETMQSRKRPKRPD
jgi:hypothetical protein